MKRLLASFALVVAAATLSGCYYYPSYGYAGSTGVYYGQSAAAYDGDYYAAPGYYGGYGYYGYPDYYGYYGCCSLGIYGGGYYGYGGGYYGRGWYRGGYYGHGGHYGGHAGHAGGSAHSGGGHGGGGHVH